MGARPDDQVVIVNGVPLAVGLILDAHLEELTRSHGADVAGDHRSRPQTAAALLSAVGDNPDRLRSAASFATLSGAGHMHDQPAA